MYVCLICVTSASLKYGTCVQTSPADDRHMYKAPTGQLNAHLISCTDATFLEQFILFVFVHMCVCVCVPASEQTLTFHAFPLICFTNVWKQRKMPGETWRGWRGAYRIVENDMMGERETLKVESYAAVWIRVVKGK